MHGSIPRGALTRLAIALVLAVPVLVAFRYATPSNQALSTRPSPDRSLTLMKAHLKPMAALDTAGTRYVRAPIPIAGFTAGLSAGRHKLVLQRRSAAGTWFKRATKYVHSGAFRFASQTGWTTGNLRFRVVLYTKSKIVDVSNVIVVPVVAKPPPTPTCASNPGPTTCAQPASTKQQRTVDAPYCQQLYVDSHVEQRTINWTWSSAAAAWVQAPTAWTTVAGSQTRRAAGVADCVTIVNQVPANAALPDLRIKDLTACGEGDSQATGGTCFEIIPAAPYDADFPALEGKKLLKFGVITMNVGAGAAQIIADRSGTNATAWAAYQTFYDSSGTPLGSKVDPGVQFYFAGDGHNHWHVRDFDNYALLNSSGTAVATAEKHGYCMQDNTSYAPWQGLAGVPASPIYTESTSCGKGLPNALTIIHGLSRGWGDTYPTTLPDQAIDITGIANGTYTVVVHADAVGAVIESNENNNTASVKIQINGNTVTVVPGSSTGGLP